MWLSRPTKPARSSTCMVRTAQKRVDTGSARRGGHDGQRSDCHRRDDKRSRGHDDGHCHRLKLPRRSQNLPRMGLSNCYHGHDLA